MPSHFHHRILQRPTTSFSSLLRQHENDVKPSAQLPPNCWFLGCKPRTRCELRKGFRHQLRTHTASYLRASVPKCVETRENFAAPATGDISWPPTKAPCNVDFHEPRAPSRHSPWEIHGWEAASERWRPTQQCFSYAPPSHALSSLELR